MKPPVTVWAVDPPGSSTSTDSSVLAGFAAMISFIIYVSLGDPNAGGSPSCGGATTAADLEQPGGMLEALGTLSSLAGIVLLSLWVMAAPGD